MEYEPAGVKDLLVEVKDTAELLIDLSFSAVLHGSDDVAEEVVELEAEVDALQARFEAWTLAGATLGGRGVETGTGMRVVAVRRPEADGGSPEEAGEEADAWVVQPGPETRVRAGDVLVAKGTRAGADRPRELPGVVE